MHERAQQAVEADRSADGRDCFAHETLDQIVVAAAAEDGAKLRRVQNSCLEDRTGVIGEAAGDGHIERYFFVAIAERIEMIRDALDDLDLRRGIRKTLKRSRSWRITSRR